MITWEPLKIAEMPTTKPILVWFETDDSGWLEYTYLTADKKGFTEVSPQMWKFAKAWSIINPPMDL